MSLSMACCFAMLAPLMACCFAMLAPLTVCCSAMLVCCSANYSPPRPLRDASSLFPVAPHSTSAAALEARPLVRQCDPPPPRRVAARAAAEVVQCRRSGRSPRH
eukprot:scaffold84396_cov59-Phaeocystis_antarctica.AAC.3